MTIKLRKIKEVLTKKDWWSERFTADGTSKKGLVKGESSESFPRRTAGDEMGRRLKKCRIKYAEEIFMEENKKRWHEKENQKNKMKMA